MLGKVLHKYTLHLGDALLARAFKMGANDADDGRSSRFEINSGQQNGVNVTADGDFLGVGRRQVNDIWHLF